MGKLHSDIIVSHAIYLIGAINQFISTEYAWRGPEIYLTRPIQLTVKAIICTAY